MVRVGPKSNMTGVLLKRHTEAQREKATEGVISYPATVKEGLRTPEDGRNKEGFFPRNF